MIVKAPHVFRSMRAASGLSLAEVATITGLSASAISRWERGSTSPTLRQTQALLDVYGKSMEDFVAMGRLLG